MPIESRISSQIVSKPIQELSTIWLTTGGSPGIAAFCCFAMPRKRSLSEGAFIKPGSEELCSFAMQSFSNYKPLAYSKGSLTKRRLYIISSRLRTLKEQRKLLAHCQTKLQGFYGFDATEDLAIADG